jgi:hypothetical protein
MQLEEALRSFADESVQRETEDLRRSGETQVAELRTMLEDIRAKARQHQQALDARLDQALRERDEALSRAHQNAAGVYGRAARLADEARAMDEAASLSAILEQLTTAGAQRADRSAMILVDERGLRVWRAHGLAAAAAPGLELSAADAGVVDAAVRLTRTVTSREDGAPPSFALPAPRDGAAFPVTVGGEVIAVLYVDLSQVNDQRRSEWPELDLLARHAGTALESLTFRQAVGLRRLAVARPSQDAQGSGISTRPVDDVTGPRPVGGPQ